jgi:chemotaxis protein CheC
MGINIDDLNNLHLDVLREIGNIGAGNAVTALAKMLNRRIDMDVPKAKILEFKEVNETLGGAETLVIGILLRITGDISGYIMFIIKYNAAHLLVNILLEKPAVEPEQDQQGEFDEMEISALKEIGNILAGSYISALSSLTNLNIQPSVPDIAIDMAGAILSFPAIEFGKIGDTVLYIETEFSEDGRKVIGDFFLIPDAESYDILLKALGVMS